MRARMGGKPLDAFPAWREKGVRLVGSRATLDASVIDDAEATRANGRTRIIGAGVGAAFIAMMAIARVDGRRRAGADEISSRR